MQTLAIELKRLPAAADLPLPEYKTPGAAGMDIVAAVGADVTIQPGDITMIPTGLTMAIPLGWECQIRPRSGLAVKHGISLPNTPATIDSDYRGEILVPLINLARTAFTVQRGMRIAQLVFAQVTTARWVEVDELTMTYRAEGGFGHTGLT
jgi:dUTP pyrophosphatase